MYSKLKKLAAAGLSIVLASSVMVPLSACIKGETFHYSQQKITPSLDSEGRLYWRNRVELVCNIGYETSTDTAISFTSSNALTAEPNVAVTLPDGREYVQGDLKPTWKAMADKLKIDLIDKYQPLKSDASITSLITEKDDDRLSYDQNGNLVSDEANCLWDFDIITGSCSAIQTVQSASKDAKFLDLSVYLEYMPNYAAFLAENPIIYLSLITDTTTGAMYYAPYFDGNDDVEKYTMIQRSWARRLLDEDTLEYDNTSTFKHQAEVKNNPDAGSISTKSTQDGDNVVIDGTQSYITSFMGTEGSWEVDVIDPADTVRMSSTVKVKVNYDSAHLNATKEGTALYHAITTATNGKPYTGESGNIVDIQNFVINETKGEVTGMQLLNILREYIDVTYLTRLGEPFYKQEGLNRSDIFCGTTAAWDVDLLAAMSRCVVTCLSMLQESGKEGQGGSISMMQTDSDLYALGGRSSFTQRISDMYALAGELYGVRGLESRYEFTYIDENGDVKDARENPDMWDALERFSAFAKEGLMYTGDVSGTDRSVYNRNSTNRGPIFFLEHDYVQTQTLYQMRLEEGVAKGTYEIPQDYDFAPILTAVSRWNDGLDKIMRFTESWRSVKNTGFCIPYESVSDNPERLSAVLAFIDFLFSKDGQILMSYGPQSTNGNINPNGWWYAEEVKGADLTDTRQFHKIAEATNYLEAQYESMDGSCFVYDGKVYKGLDYAGRSIPIMTDDNLNCFKGKSFGDSPAIGAHTLSYTNYARKVIGSALPIGNKDQGFEYQCTAQCGLDGASIVDAAINKAGIVKHVYQQVDNPEHNLWYVIMPTLLPLSSSALKDLATDDQKDLEEYFTNSSTAARNSLVRVLYNGYSNGTFDGEADMPSDAAGIIEILNALGMVTRTQHTGEAWHRLLNYYEKNIKQD